MAGITSRQARPCPQEQRRAARAECYRLAVRIMAQQQLTPQEVVEAMAEAVGDERLGRYRSLAHTSARLAAEVRPWFSQRHSVAGELVRLAERQVKRLQRLDGAA